MNGSYFEFVPYVARYCVVQFLFICVSFVLAASETLCLEGSLKMFSQMAAWVRSGVPRSSGQDWQLWSIFMCLV